MNASDNPAAAPGEIRTLLERREQLHQWLERLRSVDEGVPSRIAERVRADYTGRLEQLTEELSRHAESLESELAQLRTESDRAERVAADAADALAEMRLRHRIGELDDAAWEERRPGLEQAASGATDALGASRQAVGRLAELVGEIGTVRQSPAVSEPEPAGEDTRPREAPTNEPEAATDDDAGPADLPYLLDPEEATVEDPGAPGDDLAFLEELDRAIAASIGGTPAEAADGSAVPQTVACRECGSANDAQAWYCEICGSEI